MTSTTADVQPGDWFVVDPGGELFWWIEAGERMIDGRQSKGQRWGHCGVATRWVTTAMSSTLMCVEAEPGGAVERPWRWEQRPHLWSTGTGLSAPGMADAALGYVGAGYSFLDYAAIAAHRYRLHPLDDLLKARIASARHQICSQLVDQCAQDAGIHLFNDSRWPGYVAPLDLGLLLDRPKGASPGCTSESAA
jgi:hypothetical protein